MIEYQFKEKLEENDYIHIGEEFEKYSNKNGVTCEYKPFSFVAIDDGKQIGIITGNSYYDEIHVRDLIVDEEYRHNGIGKALMNQVEEYFKGQNFENINLTTYEFQAPEFYKKCGFEVEYIRENKDNPKLNKYFLVKHLR
jgi:ribosomal protein S18 acetylase RimI-like enzyme